MTKTTEQDSADSNAALASPHERIVMCDDGEAIEHYKKQYERMRDILQGWADCAEFYREKFEAVKQENNKLRKKLNT